MTRRPDSEDSPAAARPPTARTAKTKPSGVALVCAKCARRQGLRPRDLRTLFKAAAKRFGTGLPKSARGRLHVCESACLGPCPKRAVAVASAASLAAGRVFLLDPAAGVAAASALLPEFGPIGGLAAGGPTESSRPPP